MAIPTLRRSFIVFHLTLGLALLFLSARTAVEGFGSAAGHGNPHLAALGTLEAVGAALFLVPRTLRVGGALLLLAIGVAVLMHIVAGQVRTDLLVYGTGTWFVMVHGPVWTSERRLEDVAA